MIASGGNCNDAAVRAVRACSKMESKLWLRLALGLECLDPKLLSNHLGHHELILSII